MQDVINVLSQVAGIGALILVMLAGYHLYKALRARKESRSAIFNAERQSAADRAVRSALTTMFLFGAALVLFSCALIGQNITPPVAVAPTPTGTRRAVGTAVMPGVITPAVPTTAPLTTPLSPPTPTLTPSVTATTTAQPRKTAVVSGVGDNRLKLRRDPATTADIIAQYPDGTVLEVLDAQQTNQGIVWQRVRDAQGNEGWVANQYLVYNP